MNRTLQEFKLPASAVVASHHLPIPGVGRVRMSYLESAEDTSRPVAVISVGHVSAVPVVRIHSRCLFGDTLHSPECDCGDQLSMSLTQMHAAQSGLLIYLDQEGRGAGLLEKARAYQLAEENGIDSFDAYSHRGLEHDQRSYVDAVRVLQLLDVRRCVLLTNNPLKVSALESAGIVVERRPLVAERTRANASFLQAMRRVGHLV